MTHTEADYINAGHRYERGATPAETLQRIFGLWGRLLIKENK